MSVEDLLGQKEGSSVKDVAAAIVERKGPKEIAERRNPVRNRQHEEMEQRALSEDDGEEEEDTENTGGETDTDGRQKDEKREEPDDHSEDEEDDDASEGEDDDEAEEGADEESEDDTWEELSDSTMISVMVDGEETEVSLGDLKRRYSGEGAIERRLQEATELRNTVEKERREHMQAVEHDKAAITNALLLFEQKLFSPQVPEPDPNLRFSNPQKFNEQVSAWQADQLRLQQEKAQFAHTLQQHKQQQEQTNMVIRAQESRVLRDKMPVFKDPIEGPKMRAKIIETAKAYGFSKEDVDNAMDHRLFLMASDAAAYRELMDKQRSNEKQGDGDKNKRRPKPGQKKVRTMRPGNAQVSRVRQRDKQKKAVEKKAWETGDVRDVAATLIERPSRRR